ncbi:DotU family type IV/VI secretion system protein, partial [Aliivibrio sifiae]
GAESLADIGNTIYRLVRDGRLAEQEKVTLVDVKSKYLKKPLKRVLPPKVIIGVSTVLFAALYAATYLIIDVRFQKLLSIYQ